MHAVAARWCPPPTSVRTAIPGPEWTRTMDGDRHREAPAAAVTARYTEAMRRALTLAARGPARRENPQVGCVVLSPLGETLAEGWHRGVGTAHAEADALAHLAPGAAAGSTVVVTLEPCNHTGRTGPCTEALSAAGVARVVYASDDPSPNAAGGAARLRAAGVEVIGGVLREEAQTLLGEWLFAAQHGRPRVTLKWAMSIDARAAAAGGTSQWIPGNTARPEGQRRRGQHDAIAVGIGTILADDPALTARDERGALLDEQPIPVVFGTRTVPANAAVTRHPHPPVTMTGHDLLSDMSELKARGIRSLYVEGGPRLQTAFLRAGVVDEVLVYIAPLLLGGPNLAIGDLGPTTLDEAFALEFVRVERIGTDVLLIAHPRSAAIGSSPDIPTTGPARKGR